MRAAADRLEELQFLVERSAAHSKDWEAQARKSRKEHDEARAAMIEVKRQRDLYRTQRDATHADAAQASFELDQAQRLKELTTRPEPSRLEIAAMLKAGWFANRDADFNATDHKWWIEQADELIAAARKAK
jgi:hypothetical protein